MMMTTAIIIQATVITILVILAIVIIVVMIRIAAAIHRQVVAIHRQAVAHVIDLKTTNQLDFPVLYFLEPFINFLTPVSPLAFLSKCY